MKRSTSLTHDIISKLVLSYVVKQRREDWQQGNGGVVDVLGYTLYLQNTQHRGQF